MIKFEYKLQNMYNGITAYIPEYDPVWFEVSKLLQEELELREGQRVRVYKYQHGTGWLLHDSFIF